MQRVKAVICVLLAGIFWGCISLFMYGLADCGISSNGIVSLRMFLAAIVFLIYLLIRDREKIRIDFRDIWMFVLTGVVSVAIFNLMYSYTVISSEATIGVVLLYTSPIFTIILSAIFLKEKITIKKILAVILVFAGCLMVSGFINGMPSISFPVLLTGMGAGLFWAAYTLFCRIPLKKYSSMTTSLWSIICAAVAMLPFGIADGIPAKIAADPEILLWGLGIAIVSTVAPYALYTSGLQYMEAGKAAILVTVELVTGSLIGMIVFRESHGLLKILGIVLCVAAVVLLNVNFEKKKN